MLFIDYIYTMENGGSVKLVFHESSSRVYVQFVVGCCKGKQSGRNKDTTVHNNNYYRKIKLLNQLNADALR